MNSYFLQIEDIFPHALDRVRQSSDLSSNMQDFHYNSRYVKFSSLEFNNSCKYCSMKCFYAPLQILIIQKSCRSRNFEFLIFFQDFAAFWLKKCPNLRKNQFFEILRAKISKMKEKIKIPASKSFLYYQNLEVSKKSCLLSNFYESY